MAKTPERKRPTVFISYSHKDEVWKDRLRAQLGVLEQTHRINVWDDRQIDGGATWYQEILNAIGEAAVTLCLISPDFLRSDFIHKEEVPRLLKRRREEGMVLLPILVRPCLWEAVDWVSATQMLPRDGKSISADFPNDWDTPLKLVASRVFEIINTPAYKPPAPAPPAWPPLAEELVDIERLPKTGAELFGRKNELELLDELWRTAAGNVLSLVAAGGVGKSTLINKWLEKMRWDNYRGAERVFAWSFYSQGTNERVTSADRFISEALAWFGDKYPAQGSPWDKGRRLADLVRAQKTLLILDGMEPLQSSFDFEKGAIKDPALAMLISELARRNNGLCVITTREHLPELDRYPRTASQQNLDQISKEAGRALLRVEGVQGADSELEAASEAFANHALAVQLLATYLHGIGGHHVSNAKKIPLLKRIPEKKGRHPRRVMAAFDKRFADGPQAQLLRIMGLFARPAEIEAIDAVRAKPPIKDLTDKLRKMTQAQWQDLIEQLRDVRLLAHKSKHNPNVLDCHPLVREHFGEKLQKNNPEAWRQANSRLYEYYKRVPKKRQPDTLDQMEPLFAAVAHACMAGRHQQALDDVFWPRIRGGDEHYSLHKLGAWGADLAALSAFFETPWTKPAQNLKGPAKAFLFNSAGFDLCVLGRLAEAAHPMRAGLRMDTNREDWLNAATGGDNLSELYLASGDVENALDYARRSVQYADRSKDDWHRYTRRTTDADARHQAGDLPAAKKLFKEAERMQKHDTPQYPYLYSVQGFRFCDLLLSEGRYKEVRKRAAQTLEWATSKQWLLDIALDRLSLGRASLIEALREPQAGFAKPSALLDEAVNGLRKAGTQDHLPRGLLARAQLYRHQQSWARAWADLEEAREIAGRGQMNLHIADYHLEAARLRLAEANPEDAAAHYKEAKAAVDKMGYHRRDVELLLIHAELAMLEGDKTAARRALGRAEKKINDEGWHIWDADLARLQAKIT